MIDGLKVTISGEKLRRLLETQVQHHKRNAARWAREQTRTPEDQTEEAPLLPDHICRNEEERHVWRVEVLAFIRDHVEVGETYRLSAADLEFGEVLPRAPEWLAQDEFEERTRIGFALERIAKAIERGDVTRGLLASYHARHAGMEEEPAERIEETDEFRTRRLGLPDGPEVIVIERK